MSFALALIEVDGFKMVLHSAPGIHTPLEQDLSALKQAGVTTVVTTLTEHEMKEHDIVDLSHRCQALGMEWVHLPIEDNVLPGFEFYKAWSEHADTLVAKLRQGQRLSVHCRGGVGRTGLTSAKLLMRAGVQFEALAPIIREARPGALKLQEQFYYLGVKGSTTQS